MESVHDAHSFIDSHAGHPDAAVLAQLMRALREEHEFDLASLYRLDFATFELGLRLLHEWRLQRYYLGAAKACQLPAR